MMVDLLAVSSYKPNDDVIKEGTEGDSMYIVAGWCGRGAFVLPAVAVNFFRSFQNLFLPSFSR